MYLISALLFMIACNDAKMDNLASIKSDSTTMNSESKEDRNKQIVKASIEAINNHDLDALLKTMTPDAMDYGDGSGPAIKADSLKILLGGFLNAFPDYKGENLQYFADGENVIVYGDWKGTFKNDLERIKATGKTFDVKDCDLFKVNDEGKITEHRNIVPMGMILNQLGAKQPK
jgi:predicted ester cyclase